MKFPPAPSPLYFLFALVLYAICRLPAQNAEFELPEGSPEELVSFSEDAFEESRYAELLNLADSSDLVALGLSGDTLRQFLEYRRLNGPFLSPYELQQLPAWNTSLIAFCLKTLEANANKASTTGGGSLFRLPFGKYFSSGYRQIRLSMRRSATAPSAARPLHFRLRVHGQYRRNLQWGLALEKDAGEPWQYSQTTFLPDYHSFHFLLRPPSGNLRALALGDYELRLGQGLLIYQGYGLYKGGPPESLLAGGPRLRAHTGMDEMRFLRGAALELQNRRRHLEYLIFASRKKIDARLDSLSSSIYSLPQTAYHPSSSVSWRKQLGETLLGNSLLWRPRENSKLAFNLLYLRYDRPLQLERSKPYQLHRFVGQQSLRLSLDHRLQLKQALFFGEWALAEMRYPALMQGLLLPLGQGLDISLLYRYYHPAYTDFYAAPFSESSAARNEHGLYLGFRYSPLPHWQLEGYCDLWKKPWLSYNYNSPRRAYDGQLRLEWHRRKRGKAYLLFRFKTKEQFKTELPALYYERLHSWRFHFLHKLSPALEWRMRLERKLWTAPSGKSRGMLFYQELVFAKLGSPLRWNVRWTHYRSDSYDARLYAYERGLLDQHRISVFTGSGQRIRLNTRYKFAKIWTAEWGLSLDFHSRKISAEGIEISTQIIGRW